MWSPVRIFLIDPEPTVHELLRTLLTSVDDLWLVGSATTINQFYESYQQAFPHILLFFVGGGEQQFAISLRHCVNAFRPYA